MIAPQELKQNNLIRDIESGRIGEVLTIGEKKCTIKMPFSKLSQSYEEFEPIELTEHWLLKFGFDKKQIRADLKNKLGDYAYSLNSVPFFTLIQDNDGFMLSKFETYLITVKNVHQFQNLFHSFTGEELKIKE